MALGLKKSTLDKIEMDKGNVDACKMEMLGVWLQWADGVKEETCNWECLAEALEDPLVKHGDLAKDIRKKYGAPDTC